MKNSKFSKILCVGMAGVMMTAAFTACNKSGDTTKETEETEQGETTEVTGDETTVAAGASECVIPEKFVFDGKFSVQVLGYEYFDTADAYDYDLLNVYYDFTPLSNELMGDNYIYWSCKQAGEDQEMNPATNSKFGNCVFSDNIWISVQEGVTLRGMVSFSCKKGCTDELTIGVGENSNEYQYFSVDPKWEMPDIRHQAFEVAKVANPSFGPGNLAEATSPSGSYDIKINGVTGVYTGSGLNCDGDVVDEKVIGISYTWTNHTGKNDDAFMIASLNNYVFQDGVSLVVTGCPDDSEDAGKSQSELPEYQDIADGESITYTVYYKLRSDSPVEVVFKDFFATDCFADMVYDVPA